MKLGVVISRRWDEPGWFVELADSIAASGDTLVCADRNMREHQLVFVAHEIGSTPLIRTPTARAVVAQADEILLLGPKDDQSLYRTQERAESAGVPSRWRKRPPRAKVRVLRRQTIGRRGIK